MGKLVYYTQTKKMLKTKCGVNILTFVENSLSNNTV